MMQIRQLKFLMLGGLGLLLAAGCSRNVASVDETEPSLAVSSIKTPSASAAKAITWQPNLEAALAKAQSQGKPVMIDFYATWCGPCKLLDQEIYPDATVVQEVGNFVSVKVDVDVQTAAAEKYKVGGLPTVVFLDKSGKEFYRLIGLGEVGGEASQFAKLLRKVHSDIAARTS